MRFLQTCLTAALLATSLCHGQTQQMPRDYIGPQTYIPGIFVTPVPNAPFTAKVDIISHQILPDGTETIKTTTNHIARLSSGTIYNERRQVVPTTFKGEPALLSAHIYDPNTRLSTFLNPFTHLAREMVLPQPPTPPAHAVPDRAPVNNPYFKQEDIGTQQLSGLTLTSIRKTHTIPANMSTTGKEIVITDEYWYSPDLSIYMIIKHNDPRTGEQIVAVSEVDRHEPQAVLFAIPANYKVVDETPPPQSPSAQNPQAPRAQNLTNSQTPKTQP
jgi:hypothetical protein